VKKYKKDMKRKKENVVFKTVFDTAKG